MFENVISIRHPRKNDYTFLGLRSITNNMSFYFSANFELTLRIAFLN